MRENHSPAGHGGNIAKVGIRRDQVHFTNRLVSCIGNVEVGIGITRNSAA